ncbi:MAG: DUF5780 domain-containing protein [Candidatus Gastranaerophilales bacterium]|nr:DUF5780 domain-containing protein [Candidatus Gastranaerophilales bacterium]
MSEFIKILLSLSVSGTLLLLLILGLKQFYKNRFSRSWQYYIWIIVVFRFLLPFTPDTTIVGSLFEKFNTTSIANEKSINPNMPVTVNTGSNEKEQERENVDINANTGIHNWRNAYTGIFLVWAVLVLVLFVCKITLYQGFAQYIKAGNTEISDIKTLNLLSDCEEKLNIKARVEIYRNVLITSPMLIGFFHPRIVLPVRELEDDELSYIFVHELIHYKQKDMFYKWLIQIVVCIHWFNPFIYLLEKEVNKSCELSCDEKVISILGDKARREYGDILISFLKSNNLYKSSLASVTLTESAEQVKERLVAIMNFKKETKLITIISLVTAFLLSAGGFAMGAYAAQPTPQENRAGLTGDIEVQENNSGIKETMSIIHESADILFYENGSPYIHDILTNHTDKRITETEYCMLAYNENGSPLKLHWNFLDSSTESSYENLVRTKTSILSNQTEDYNGGWSLYDGELTENMPRVESGETDNVTYALFCLKQVVFEDGTIWNNPNYDSWFEDYMGKEIDINELQNYYPHHYELE